MSTGDLNSKILLLGLAATASLLELGPIVALIREGENIAAILCAGLAYQIGNAAPKPTFRHSRIIFAVVVAVSTATLMLASATSPQWLTAIAGLSWALQCVRRRVAQGYGEKNLTTIEKRTARVVGFVFAAMLPIGAILLIAFFVVFSGILSATAESESSEQWNFFGNRIECAMLVHQTHYFAYAYAVPLLVTRSELGGETLIGLWFALGWISYLSAESMWHKIPPRIAFVSGHIFLAAILILLTFSGEAPWITAGLWILSGFGGGTVYCLTLLHDRQKLPHSRLESAEDAGHLLGVAIALLGVLLIGMEAGDLPILGAAFALIAAAIVLSSLRDPCYLAQRGQADES